MAWGSCRCRRATPAAARVRSPSRLPAFPSLAEAAAVAELSFDHARARVGPRPPALGRLFLVGRGRLQDRQRLQRRPHLRERAVREPRGGRQRRRERRRQRRQRRFRRQRGDRRRRGLRGTVQDAGGHLLRGTWRLRSGAALPRQSVLRGLSHAAAKPFVPAPFRFSGQRPAALVQSTEPRPMRPTASVIQSPSQGMKPATRNNRQPSARWR